MTNAVGVDIVDDAQGCLQDIHWSFGAVGYFPSYTLGAIMATQIFNAACADPILGGPNGQKLRDQLSRGEFQPLREWLREKVHCVGSIHSSPDELLQSICGESLSPQPFLAYLRSKYGAVYGL
jgi:Zn-dependent M32 family carboxypeptidase